MAVCGIILDFSRCSLATLRHGATMHSCCWAAGWVAVARGHRPRRLIRDLLSSSGPLNADQQTSAWLDTFRNAGLPLFVIGYALRRRYEVASGRSHTGTPADVIWAAAGTVVVVCLLSLLASAGHQLLPRLMLGDSYGSAMVAVNVVVCLLCLAAAAVLVSRPPYSILGRSLHHQRNPRCGSKRPLAIWEGRDRGKCFGHRSRGE
jgi:hypothetical protein